MLRARAGSSRAEHIRRRTGQDVTAKDFRTLRGTIIAAQTPARQHPASDERDAATAITRAVQHTAEVLGNTPAVARASYIGPRVFDRYRSGQVIGLRHGHSPERALIELLCS
jgi:DNA topoisomerase-1